MRLSSPVLLALLAASAFGPVQAAQPVPAAAVFLDEAQAVPLRNGSAAIYQDSQGRAQTADAACVQAASGRVVAGSATACPKGASAGFVDRASGRVASKGHGLSEFMTYRLAGAIPAPSLDFKTSDGTPHTAVIVVMDGGGSGTFYSLGVVSGASDGKQGSHLVPLGDRVIPYWMEFDERHHTLSISYLDRAENTPMTAEPTVRKHRRFHVEGRKLVELR